MSLPCEKCAAPLPDPSPGFSLVTCRACGTAQMFKARAQAGGASPSQTPHTSSAFVVREDKGALCIGWSHFSLTPLLVPLGFLAFLPLIAIRAPETAKLLVQPPLVFIVGGVLALITYVALAHALNTTWVEIRGQELSLVTRPLPLPRSAAVDTRTVRSLSSRTYEQQVARHFRETRHAVCLKTQEGRLLSLADNLATEFDAEWLGLRISEHLGVPFDGRR